ncbi:unnamed protein product [Gadus morhua 'NCC']
MCCFHEAYTLVLDELLSGARRPACYQITRTELLVSQTDKPSNAHSVPLGARCYDVSRGLAPARPGGFNHMPGERTLFHGRLQEGLSAKPREKGFEVIPKAAPARDQPRSNSLDPGPAAVGPICTAAHAAEPDMPFTEPDTHVRT